MIEASPAALHAVRMRRRVLALLALGASGCGGASGPRPLYGAGTDRDDGHGLLARASSGLLTSEDGDDDVPDERARDRGGDARRGEGDGIDGPGAYGGASYATYTPPAWSAPSVDRTPGYRQQAGLHGAIEGTIRWRGAAPTVTTPCGPIQPLRVGADAGVGGVLVYIAHVTVGRVLPHGDDDQRPSTVGGVVIKRGCGFAPTTQVVTPLPAALAIHGDARPARLAITMPTGTPRRTDLRAGGRVMLPVEAGVTRIESEDRTLGAAWVVALDTPAYALTDDAGRFRLDELAPGTYEVSIWQPPLPTVVDGRLSYGAPRLVQRTVRVGPGRPARLDVILGR